MHNRIKQLTDKQLLDAITYQNRILDETMDMTATLPHLVRPEQASEIRTTLSQLYIEKGAREL